MKARIELTGRENNLNLLRFVAALLVIFSHAYVLTGNGADPITRATRGQTTGGQLAVLLFFFYGGLLIMKSLERRKTARAFFEARVLRIFPALWIVVLGSVLLLGPALTALPMKAYLLNGGTWKYLLNGLLIPVHDLPGVFENNPAMATVNGALWTLPVEFCCYVICFAFCRLGLADGKKPLILLPVAVAVAYAARALLGRYEVLQNAVLPVLFFYIGMVCCVYRDSIPLNGWAALAAAALLIVSVIAGVFPYALCVLYPYILLYLGFGTPKKLSGFGRKLELSYAIYLTGFPIQQTLLHFVPGMSPMANCAAASCVAIIIAVPVTLLDRRLSSRLRGRKEPEKNRREAA